MPAAIGSPGARAWGFHPKRFFLNDTATTQIYTLSLHDALPISAAAPRDVKALAELGSALRRAGRAGEDRKSTRLNSSHANSSYAVSCLKKKNASQWHSPPQTIQTTRNNSHRWTH